MEVQIILKGGEDWLFRGVERFAALPTRDDGVMICVWHQGSGEQPNFKAPLDEVRFFNVRG